MGNARMKMLAFVYGWLGTVVGLLIVVGAVAIALAVAAWAVRLMVRAFGF